MGTPRIEPGAAGRGASMLFTVLRGRSIVMHIYVGKDGNDLANFSSRLKSNLTFGIAREIRWIYANLNLDAT